MATQTPTRTASPGASGQSNRPVKEIRHRNIRATVWRNSTRTGVMYNVTVSRSYKDDKEEWHDSSSFGFNDLMNLAKALYDAHSAIAHLIAEERSANGSSKPATSRRS